MINNSQKLSLGSWKEKKRDSRALTKVRELNGFLDKKYRDIVGDDIPIALLRIKFNCKSSNIADGVSTPFAPLYS